MHVVCPNCETVNRLNPERVEDGPVCGRCREPLFTGRPLALSSVSFDRHIERTDPLVVVDFWAEWCGPCKMMAPQFAEAARQMIGLVQFAKVDTEAAPDLAARFGIRSIPTLVLFHGGREVDRVSGAMSATQLVGWLHQHRTRVGA